MTVTSMSRLPAADAPAAPTPGAGRDDASAAEGFGALVAAHLATLAETAAQDTGDTAMAGSAAAGQEATGSDGSSAGDVGDLDEATTADGTAPALPDGPVAASAPVLIPIPPPGNRPVVNVVAGAPTPGVEESGDAVGASSAGGATTQAASDQDAATDWTVGRMPGRSVGATGETGLVTIIPGAGAVDETSAGFQPAVTAVTEPTTAAGASSYGAVPLAVSEATLGGPGPASPAGPAGSTGQATAGAVTSQVFPTVPALVSRGEGTHSITLRLHPADLGEVHITVTVRDGAVQVTLAAGPEAQEALRAGSGELSALLDLAGASGGQLVVRDMPSGPAPGPTSGSFQLPTGQTSTEGGHAPRDEDTPAGRPARADVNADDAGLPDATPRPQVRTAAGLDLIL